MGDGKPLEQRKYLVRNAEIRGCLGHDDKLLFMRINAVETTQILLLQTCHAVVRKRTQHLGDVDVLAFRRLKRLSSLG